MSVQIKIEGSKVSFPKWAFKPMAMAWRRRIAPVILEALKTEAPVYKYNDTKLSRGQKPGDLKNSIKLDSLGGGIGSGVEMVFVADVKYAKFVISGTRPHRIPLNGDNTPLLHWNRDGQDVYRRNVFHKGTKANDFPKRAIERVQPMISRTLEVTVSEFIKPEQA